MDIGGKQPDPFGGLKATPPSQDAPPKPGIKDFAFLIINNCSHVVIDGLRIRECWPSILFLKDASHVQIRNCVWRHGTYAIYAKDNTTHLLVENNEWQQDNSPDHQLWSKLDWSERMAARARMASSGITMEGFFRPEASAAMS